MYRLSLFCALLFGALLLAPAAFSQERAAPTDQLGADERVPVYTRPDTGTDAAGLPHGKPEAERAPRYRAVPGTERLVLTPEGLAQARAFAAQKTRIAVAERSAADRRPQPPREGEGKQAAAPARSAYLTQEFLRRLEAPEAQREVEAGFNGNNSGGPTFARPLNVGNGTSGSCSVSSSTTHPYEVNVFDVSESGLYDVFASYDGYDGFLLLYAGSFTASDPCRNLIALDDDFNGLGASLIEDVQLNTGTTYRAVVTTFSSANPGGPYTGYVAEANLLPTVFVVENTFDDSFAADANPGDGVCEDTFSSCTLRAAIQETNATAGTGPVFIAFDIAGGSEIAPGVWRITLGFDGNSDGFADVLPNILRGNVTVDALTQPGATCGNLVNGVSHDLRVVLDGSNTTGDVTDANSGFGIGTSGANPFTVRGLVVQNFAFGFGIYVLAPNGLTECNYVGTDYTGETAAGNLDGIYSGGTIRNNLASGNDGIGIVPRVFSPTTVSRNLVGSDDDGNQRLGNGGVGIFVASTDHVITTNLASANGNDGIRLGADPFFGSSNVATGIEMTNNTVGLTRTRTDAGLGNGRFGIYAHFGASNNDIGLPGTGQGNFVAANFATGIIVSGTGTNNNRVRGNTIGLTASGAAAPNFQGIVVFNNFDGSPSGTVIGGSGAGAGNVASGNIQYGIYLESAPNTRVEGNTVGLTASGTARPNVQGGINVDGSSNAIVRGNTASGNTGTGISASDFFFVSGISTNALIENNRIGTNAAGTAARPNGLSGLVLTDATGATVRGNTISANADAGVFLSDGTSGHTFTANFIGTNSTQTANLGNGLAGLLCQDATNVQFGLNGTGNVVAFNDGDGVFLLGGCQEISVVGNVIFSNGGLGVDLAPNGVTLNDLGDGDTGANTLLNFPVLTSAENNGTNARITWTLNARPSTTYQLLFCRLPAPDPSGYGECNVPNALETVTTNGAGNASGTKTLAAAAYPAGSWVSANATKAVGALPAGYGPTSEFSQARQVTDTSTPPGIFLTATNTSSLTVAPGGSVSFAYTIQNNTPAAVTGDLFFTAQRAGTTVAQGVVVSGTLPAGQTITSSFTQGVPSSAPPGTYTYRLRIGQFPNVTVDQVAFTVTVTGSAREGAAGTDAWPVSEVTPWQVVATAEAEGAAEASSRGEAALPSEVTLAAAYPNPFSRSTTVGFALPETQRVRLTVFDVLGREVAVLVDGEVEAGRHEALLDGASLPAGGYLVRLVAAGQTRTQRLTLVR